MTDQTAPDDNALLEALFAGAAALKQLAKRQGVNVQRLAAWSSRPDILSAISSLRRLADARADLVVSGARTEAARALLRLAKDNESRETARKACVDLLKLRIPLRDDLAPASSEQGLDPDATDAVRAMLEKLAARTTDQRPAQDETA